MSHARTDADLDSVSHFLIDRQIYCFGYLERCRQSISDWFFYLSSIGPAVHLYDYVVAILEGGSPMPFQNFMLHSPALNRAVVRVFAAFDDFAFCSFGLNQR